VPYSLGHAWCIAHLEASALPLLSLVMVSDRLKRRRIRTLPYVSNYLVWIVYYAVSDMSLGGPPRYSEIRINIAQAFNGIGTVVAPVLASYVFFKNTGTDQSALQNVQWTYLAIACFVFALAVVYYFSPIPEITGMHPESSAKLTH
jgi:hypothetical protein